MAQVLAQGTAASAGKASTRTRPVVLPCRTAVVVGSTMPRKIRQLKADLRRAGFVLTDRGKGSHEVWEHPDVPTAFVTLSGHDGDDARPYHERDLRRAIALATRPTAAQATQEKGYE